MIIHWSFIGHSLVFHWSFIGHPLVMHWSSIGHPLVIHWSLVSPIFVTLYVTYHMSAHLVIASKLITSGAEKEINQNKN